MDPHRFRGGKKLDGKAVLQERFATAQCKPARHYFQAMTIFS
jgi:hypothetical protein